jgi:eukaryotic-like serine/threonine-protein kinase
MKTPATPEEWEKFQRLFEQVVEQSPEGRAAVLEQICGSDDELKSQLQKLLVFHQEDEGLLDRPLIPSTLQSGHMIGQRIGLYRVKALLGEGGMGEVYLAERDDGEFRKQVAVKVLRVGLGYGLLSKRFESERQILAQLEHANIARLLDGGKTKEGLPYFVLEYVEGLPIDEYCDTNRLGISERLILFCKICDAVHSAHCNLVIHRDIKPGNILVGADGEPKLLDFGIAKFLSSDPLLTPADSTLTLLRAMTPQYASPEQVRGEVVTTASDVYSLGILLYELLTGHRPYNAPDLTLRAVRAICEEEPQKPSTAVAREDDLIETRQQKISRTPHLIALCRSTSPSRLRRTIMGDIDNILLKALRKEPEHRYSSAEQFAGDIYQHLRGLPVSARKDTFAYRAAKFIYRNKFSVAAATFAAVALISGTGIALWQAREAWLSQIRVLETSALSQLETHRIQPLLESFRAAKFAERVPGTPELLKLHTAETLEQSLEAVQQVNVFEKHSAILGLSINPDGSSFASAGSDGVIRVWSSNGNLIKAIHAHVGWVYGVCFSPDGLSIVSAGRDGTAKLWNREGALLHTFKGHLGPVTSATFSPDGRTIATSSDDGTAKLWTLDGKNLLTLRGHSDILKRVVFSPDGHTIATASSDTTAKLWDLHGNELKTLHGHKEAVVGVRFSPDGKKIVTVSRDGTAILWGSNGDFRRRLQGHMGHIYDAAFDPNSNLLVTVSLDEHAKLWNEDGKLLRSYTLGAGITSVAFTPSGQHFVAGTLEGVLEVWAIENPLRQQLENGKVVEGVDLGSDGDTIAEGNADGSIGLWRLNDHTYYSIKGNYGGGRVVLDPRGELLLVAGGMTRANVVRLPRLQPAFTLTHKDFVDEATFNSNGQLIASASFDGTVKIWSRKGKLLRSLFHGDWVHAVSFSPLNNAIATAGRNKMIKLWDSTGKLLWSITGHTDDIVAIAFAPDGETIASSSWDGTVKLWTKDGKLYRTLIGHQGRVYDVEFSPNGEFIASAGEDKQILIWNKEGSLMKTLRGHKGAVLSLRFSKDGRTLASSGTDGNIFLWRWNTKKDKLLDLSCAWLADYLRNGEGISEDERTMCNTTSPGA